LKNNKAFDGTALSGAVPYIFHHAGAYQKNFSAKQRNTAKFTASKIFFEKIQKRVDK